MPRTLFSALVLPSEGMYASPESDATVAPVRSYLPLGYEPNYAYPLIVLFHAHGSSDEQSLRLAPRISRRNHIYVGIRGPVDLGEADEDGLPARGWGEPGQFDKEIAAEMMRAVSQICREFHVHSERVYLAGIAEGATVAYRMAQQMPRKFAGVIAINGVLPRSAGSPVFHTDEAKHLRVMIGHGAANEVVPLEVARRDYLALYGAGASVTLNTYPSAHTVHPHMLRDINRWVIDNVDDESMWDADAEFGAR